MGSNIKVWMWILICLFQWQLFFMGVRWLRKRGLEIPGFLGIFAILFLVLASELLGFSGIITGRVLFILLLFLGAYELKVQLQGFCFQSMPQNLFKNLYFWPGVLFAVSLGVWGFFFRDLACLPSVDDGSHHLFFYSRIQESLTAITSRIPLLRSDTFGSHYLGYYPSGFHALVAVTAFPVSFLFRPDPMTELQGMSLLLLGAFPLFLFLGVRRVCPSLSIWAAGLASGWAGGLAIFPLNAMGEGGISRVAGHVLAIPFVFEGIQSRLRFWECFIFCGFILPVFFWIHPSSVVVAGGVFAIRFLGQARADVSRNLSRSLGTFLGASVGGFLIWNLLQTGSAREQASVLAQSFIQAQELSWSAWVDRMKGPIHYLFADSAGYGKFLSPRNLLADFGILMLLARRRPVQNQGLQILRPYLYFLLFLPFVLASLVFTSFPLLNYVGLVFYHFVKRICELGFWPLWIGWVVGFAWIEERFSKSLPQVQNFAVAVFGVALIVSVLQLDQSFKEFNRTFRSATRTGIHMALESVEREDAPQALWQCDTLDFQPLVSLKSPQFSQRVFFKRGTECLSAPANENYCQRELAWIDAAQRLGNSKQMVLNSEGRGCLVVHPQSAQEGRQLKQSSEKDFR